MKMYIELTARIERPGQVTAVIVECVRDATNNPDRVTLKFTDMLDNFEETVIDEIHRTTEPYQMTLEDYV
ncbi:hypothetical protein D3C76_1322060 [compost metagenome]